MDSFACSGGLPPRRNAVQAGTTRLSYLEWGADGPPLLLLHGITSSAQAWWRVAPVLVARGYHVYAPDMPGHGESDTAGSNSIDHIASLIASLVTTLALDRLALIGHSWGGAAALALASTGASRATITRVILIDPALRIDPTWGTTVMPRYLEGLGMSPDETLPSVRAANPDWHECDIFWKVAALQQCRDAAVRGLFLDSGGWDLTARLAELNVPLLLLVADAQHTIIAPEVLAAADQALQPGLGELVTVPGTNHNMVRGGFDLVMPIITAWLGDSAL